MTNNLRVAEQTSIYDEAFLQRYESIYKWGLYITKHNRELTEDLVHEVYVKFTAAGHNMTNVDSFDKYLFVALRNSYLTHLRKINRRRVNQFAVLDYDSVDHALLAVDPQEQIRTRESLRAVCQYACFRKKTSISASILILRFFHGYYLNEVALILKSSRNAVDVRLRLARREAAAYLNDPAVLNFAAERKTARHLTDNIFRNYQDIIEESRHTIFSAQEGVCLDTEKLSVVFQNGSRITREVLAHVVSCQHCLTRINNLHGLPPLSERHPLDTLGKDTMSERKTVMRVKRMVAVAGD